MRDSNILTEQCDCTADSEGERRNPQPVTIEADGEQVWLSFPGYETRCGDNALVGVEVWDGRLRVCVWDDPDREDPTIVDLERMQKAPVAGSWPWYECKPCGYGQRIDPALLSTGAVGSPICPECERVLAKGEAGLPVSEHAGDAATATGDRASPRLPKGRQGAGGRDRLESFLREGGFVVLGRNRHDPSPNMPVEAWAYRGPLDFSSAEPVVFGLGSDCRQALEALAARLPASIEPGEEPAPMHPAIRRIHDLLYLDMDHDREFYNPDKMRDTCVVEAITEVVGEYIPRPQAPHGPSLC